MHLRHSSCTNHHTPAGVLRAARQQRHLRGGAGGALGSYANGYRYRNDPYTGFHLGARAVLGLEYTIPSVPLNFAIHTGPYIGLVNSYGFGWHGSFAIRFAFK